MALQVANLITDGEGYLLAGERTGLVISYKRPFEDGYRTGEHSLHRQLGARLCEGAPIHGHRLLALHVAIDYWWFHAAGTVALNPSVLGEGKACQLLAEILHHVVALKLAVHQHIQSNLLLPFYAFSGFFLQQLIVFGSRNFALPELGTP